MDKKTLVFGLIVLGITIIVIGLSPGQFLNRDYKPPEKEEIVVDIPNDAELIGSWYDDRPGAKWDINIYKIDGDYMLQFDFPDGGIKETEVQYSLENDQVKFDTENEFGEYYIINRDTGNLEMYDTEGHFGTAYKN